MKIEDKIEKMKRVYLSTPVSDDDVAKEWQILQAVLGEQQKRYLSPLFFRAFALAAITLLFTGGVVTLAQASKPGELLYPVKEFSQKVVNEVKKATPVFINEKSEQSEHSDEQKNTPNSNSPQKNESKPEVKKKDGSHSTSQGSSEEGSGQAGSRQEEKVKGSSDKKTNIDSKQKKKHSWFDWLQRKNEKSDNHGSANSPQDQEKSNDNSSRQ